MAKVNRSYRLFDKTVAEIGLLVARKYGKTATQVIEQAVHAAVFATANKKKAKP